MCEVHRAREEHVRRDVAIKVLSPGSLAVLVVVLSLAFWPRGASAQETRWDTLINTGSEAYQRGDYAQAEELFSDALEKAEEFGPDDSRVRITFAWLTVLNDIQILGPGHLALAKSLDNLADLLATVHGDYAGAESLRRQTLTILEKAVGPEHPQVAIGLNNLAVLYNEQGKYAEAEPLHKRALAIREKALGPEHPDVGWSLNNLA
ncbi:MAG: tetratricopeptide repeat protein, partial [Acidobacteria bacterium]|nr:tetratricopeptide repeat protein [Acidobacteriota bacterium]